jgi:hypothetical protein
MRQMRTSSGDESMRVMHGDSSEGGLNRAYWQLPTGEGLSLAASCAQKPIDAGPQTPERGKVTCSRRLVRSAEIASRSVTWVLRSRDLRFAGDAARV